MTSINPQNLITHKPVQRILILGHHLADTFDNAHGTL